MRLLRLLSLASLLALTACASVHAPAGATFVIVRHAEKANDGTPDPPLNETGSARAQSLAQRLSRTPLLAAYATSFKRTRQTAQPAAALHAIAVTGYDAAEPASVFAARLRARHDHGTVLVVGHSNTVPAIAAALCACAVAPLGDEEYDRIYTIHLDRQGRAALDQGWQSRPVDMTSP